MAVSSHNKFHRKVTIMKNIFSFLGSFRLSSGILYVVDPYITPINVYREKILDKETRLFSQKDVLPGLYHTYHVIDNKTGNRVALCGIHDTYSLDDFDNFTDIVAGTVLTDFSNCVAVIDKRFWLDTSSCYGLIYDESLYVIEDLLENLNLFHYSHNLKEQLKGLYELNLTHKKILISGRELKLLLKNEGLSNTFRSPKIQSNLWSYETIMRTNSSFINGVIIKGGVCSTSTSMEHRISFYHNSNGEKFAFRISLI